MIYVKFAAIKKGEANAEGHKGADGWMEVGSVGFGAGRSISTPVGAASKREASAPHIAEIQISKLQDSTSPLLFQESLIGKAGDCQIDLPTGDQKPSLLHDQADQRLGRTAWQRRREAFRVDLRQLYQDRKFTRLFERRHAGPA